jgi:hypothetical protein
VDDGADAISRAAHDSAAARVSTRCDAQAPRRAAQTGMFGRGADESLLIARAE